MSISLEDVVSRLISQSDAMARLAQNEGGFSAVAAAFESKDPNAFRWVLDRLEMLPYCELICEWVRIKLCVLRCEEICWPLRIDAPIPTLEEFARAVARLGEDKVGLRRVVDAVACGNREEYAHVLDHLKLRDFCSPICHWVCGVSYRRICEVVCGQQPIVLADAAGELHATSALIASLVRNEKALAAISKAALTGNCEALRSTIGEFGFGNGCEIICRLICSWRCYRVCRELCLVREPVLAAEIGVEEARSFALAFRRLAAQPRALSDLVSAVEEGDKEAYAAIIDRFGLWPYCRQICSWVCTSLCHRFCYCVCPPDFLHPWFTHVGDFSITPGADIDTVTGLTIKAENGHGGPNYAFYSCLHLRGFCPKYDPAHPSEQMAYRFLYQAAGAVKPTPMAGGTGDVCEVLVGSRYTTWHGSSVLQPVRIRGTGMTSPTPPISTPDPAPPNHYIVPDDQGWVYVDKDMLDDGFDGDLMGFNSANAFPGGDPAPGVAAGTAVPAPNQKNGVSAAIIFQATRVSTIVAVNGGAAPDYTNQLDTIRINNWPEVNERNFAEFVTGCCTPIDATLSVQFTVDHEELGAGGWSLGISSCALPASGINLTPPNPPTPLPPEDTVVFTAGGRGASGTILVDTRTWCNCSYTVTLSTTPGLTDGLNDRGVNPNPLTFAICDHDCPTLTAAITATQTTVNVSSGTGFPAAPFTASVPSTGETMMVTGVAGTTWTVTRGEDGTAAAAAPAGASVIRVP